MRSRRALRQPTHQKCSFKQSWSIARVERTRRHKYRRQVQRGPGRAPGHNLRSFSFEMSFNICDSGAKSLSYLVHSKISDNFLSLPETIFDVSFSPFSFSSSLFILPLHLPHCIMVCNTLKCTDLWGSKLKKTDSPFRRRITHLRYESLPLTYV